MLLKSKRNKLLLCKWLKQRRMEHTVRYTLYIQNNWHSRKKKHLSHKKWTQKMKIFHDHSVQSKQRKFIRGHIHNTEKKKKKTKQTSKHDWTRFALRLCQLKLKICSSNYGVNISSLILNLQDSSANCSAAWFISRATFRGSRVVHAAQHLFWVMIYFIYFNENNHHFSN